ncbi:MAG: MFS transporter [Candidatus Lokiarchaeota archaeon]|nr:MFS transporter [Candidatus Lokiarchaeota archaeon]
MNPILTSYSAEKKTQIREFYSLSISSLLHFSILGLLSPYIAIYFKRGGLPFGILFLIFLANNLGNIAQPVWGGLSDRFDRRKIFIVLASIMWLVFGIIIYITPEFIIFVIFFGLASFFGSSVQPIARSLIAFISLEGEETEYQSKFGVLLTTSFTISAWLGGMIADFYDFNTLFFIVMILAFLSLIISTFTVPEYRMSENANKIKDINKKDNKYVNFNQKLKNLFKNNLFVIIVVFSFLGGFCFYFFFSFMSVFFSERGLNLSLYSWSFILSFSLFMLINYIGEAYVKRKIKIKKDIVNLTEEENAEIARQKNQISIKLKMVFIFWSILGFLTLCILITLISDMSFIILILYSFPIVPFFFTSMLALTSSVVDLEHKALAIGVQGVFVFGGRSLTVYVGSIFLDIGGFPIAALVNIFLMIILLLMAIYTFKKLEMI